MKRLIRVGVSLAVVIAAGFWMARRSRPPVAQETPATESSPATAPESAGTDNVSAPKAGNFDTPVVAPSARTAARRSQATAPLPDAAADERAQFRQSVDQLVSPQTSFEDKYHMWIKLRDEGKMEQVIAELYERATNNPAAAEYPAALGQAYLHKGATTQDVREQGILGMKADQTFDAALTLDPANWEAGFYKAMALSYWPKEMNRSTEVIQRFTQLIEQQEAAPTQPHFAQSYIWLGEQYRKAGRTDYADQVWQRGAALFPNDPLLKQKLAALP